MQATMSPNSSIRVRAFVVEDLKTVHALFSTGFMYYARQPEFGDIPADVANGIIQENINDDLSKIEDVYFGSGGHFWVAVADDDNANETIVGIVGLEGKPNNEGELRRMSVREDYRRFGVGRLLVSTLENWAKDNGMTKIVLSTGALMLLANKFYVSIGYTVAKREVSSKDPNFVAVHYEKLLK